VREYLFSLLVNFSAKANAASSANQKRESKAYSYKEQKIEMELREVSGLLF